MSFAEWSNSKRKKRQEEQEQIRRSNTQAVLGNENSFSAWSNAKMASRVNEDYIKTFLSDANNFLSSAQKDYKGVNGGNVSSIYSSLQKNLEDLNTRKNIISIWLNNNKDRLDEKAYSSLSAMLEKYDSDTKNVMEALKGAEELPMTPRGYLNGWNDNEFMKKDPSQGFLNKELKKKKELAQAAAELEVQHSRLQDSTNSENKSKFLEKPWEPSKTKGKVSSAELANIMKNRDIKSGNLWEIIFKDYESAAQNPPENDKIAQLEHQQKLDSQIENQNKYRIVLNEMLAKEGLPHLSTEALEEYNKIYSENSPSANDDAYDRQRKRNNITQLNLTFQAVLSGDFSSTTQIGLNKKETDFKGYADLWDKHSKINGSSGGKVEKYSLLSQGEKQVWNY